MELFATGFNAWNQLLFTTPTLDEEPHDLHSFNKVLSGHQIEPPTSRLSLTIVRIDGCLRVAGHPPLDQDIQLLHTSVETARGQILTIANDIPTQHASLAAWKSGAAPQVWPCTVKQVAAFDTGFVILHADGSVSTLGDARFENTLGRDVTAEEPAHAPAVVPDLNDLNDPVTHVAAGGLSAAALTRSGSVYVWGTSSAGTHRAPQAFPSIGGVPNYTPVDGDKDVRDVALGESHAIALTADGCVYVIGDNGNGQLGIAGAARAGGWTRVPFDAPEGFDVVGVAAGPRTSFIITSATVSNIT